MYTLEDDLLDSVFQTKFLKANRIRLHKEATSLYGPLYFLHPDYVESDLGIDLNYTHKKLEHKILTIKKLTNTN
jgi:hypothetical protein